MTDVSNSQQGSPTNLAPECPDCRRLMARSTEAIMAGDYTRDAYGCFDCDTKPRTSGCRCHQEEGDSDCPVHNEPADVSDTLASTKPNIARPDATSLRDCCKHCADEHPDGHRYACTDCDAERGGAFEVRYGEPEQPTCPTIGLCIGDSECHGNCGNTPTGPEPWSREHAETLPEQPTCGGGHECQVPFPHQCDVSDEVAGKTTNHAPSHTCGSGRGCNACVMAERARIERIIEEQAGGDMLSKEWLLAAIRGGDDAT